MNHLVSGFGSLNFRERIKALLMVVAGALLGFIYDSAAPFVTHIITTHEIDFSLFTAVVNWGTLLQTAIVSGCSYLGITVPTGKSGVPFSKK